MSFSYLQETFAKLCDFIANSLPPHCFRWETIAIYPETWIRFQPFLLTRTSNSHGNLKFSITPTILCICCWCFQLLYLKIMDKEKRNRTHMYTRVYARVGRSTMGNSNWKHPTLTDHAVTNPVWSVTLHCYWLVPIKATGNNIVNMKKSLSANEIRICYWCYSFLY